MAGNGGVPEEFSGSSEERAIAVLDRIPGFDYEDGEFEESSEKESENLILSLGGSKRHGDGENSVVNLVKIVNQLPWRVFGNNYSEVPVLIISGEPMDESTISDEVKSVYNAGDGSSGFRPYFLHVTIPMISTDLIPIVSRNPELQAARAEKIAATTVNSLAELGEEQITRSPFMQRLANGFTTYKKIFVHNELWIDGQPRVCDNLFLERTPCILAALKKAVDTGTTVYFIHPWTSSGHRCKSFPYAPVKHTPAFTSYAEWTKRSDVTLVDPFAPRKGGKRKTRRQKRSRARTRVQAR